MSIKYPRPTYGAVVLPYILQVIRWLMENVGTNMTWWMASIQPILEPIIWPIAPTFLAGLFVQDLYNKDSWIRENFKNWTRKFEVMFTGLSEQPNPHRQEGYVRIRFTRPIKKGRLILRIHSCLRPDHATQIHPIEVEKLDNVMKDEIRTIKIFTVYIREPGWTPYHNTWGNFPPNERINGPLFVDGAESYVDIELEGSGFTQKHRIYVNAFVAEAHPSIYMQSEDKDVFNI